MHGDAFALALSDHFSQRGADWQLVSTVTERHECAPEWIPIHRPGDLDQSARAEKLGGAWHHDIDPATFVRAFPKGGCKGFVEPACCHVSTPNGLASEASLEKPAPSGLTGGPLSWLRGLDATYSEPASSYD